MGIVKSHFLDSGAFTLWTKAAAYAKKTGEGRWSYYDTDEFWSYMDCYAAFVKEYAVGIDLYANVDVIPNPELTWRNQRYLERQHGLRPVPVVHCTEDFKWLHHYMDRGYEYIGLGGLGKTISRQVRQQWLDRAFHVICDAPNRLPRIKVHGFAITDYTLMLRYPWWSVDSTRWCLLGAYGGILVPHKRKGVFVFSQAPYTVWVSNESPKRKEYGQHFVSYPKAVQVIICEWLAFIGILLGNDQVIGVTNDTYQRRIANLRFFAEAEKHWPPWPQPLRLYKPTTITSLL